MQKYVLKYFILMLSVLLFASCEKGIDTVEQNSTVYLPMYGLSEQTVLLGESILELGVYKAGINQKNAEITVTLKIDQEAFNEFLASNPGYKLLPETYYSILSPSVELSKNKEREFYKIHLKGIDESFVNKKYILPVSIESVSPEANILEEGKTVFLSFSKYRNAWECLYKSFGKVTSSVGGNQTVIDERINATTLSANSIKIKGAENNMNLLLTIQGNNVAISGASGSENYNIKNTDGKSSAYVGTFDPVTQSNRGTFTLFYSYTLNGQQMNAEVELKFWQ
jgi:hypothetical protein